MIIKHSPRPPRKQANGVRRVPPVELLSARLLRLRIARGFSIDDLTEAPGVSLWILRRLETGKPVDKRELAPLAAALGVPLCELVCGDHDCTERACVPSNRLRR
ncbi:MAG: hypothetical protein JWM87_59 [Candidatus Eremiobacteraeota bacterium]|nr:hypothetical protein [Candidatus Eremiobacteraeota bacterium]